LKSNLEYASFYAEKYKFKVFPVHYISACGDCSCGKIDCLHPGKHPYGPLAPNGFQNATDNLLVIDKWWSDKPNVNIGIATGEVSGIIVIDIDKHKTDGEMELKKLFEKYNVCGFPETLKVSSGGGGFHCYFQYTHHLCKSVSLTGIDVKSNGGYILAPPSNHKSGNFYTWTENPSNTALAEVPQWFIDEVLAKKEVQKKVVSDNFDNKVLYEGARNNGLMSSAGKLRHLGCDQTEIEATLLVLNEKRCSPPLPENEVKSIAKSVLNYPSGNKIDVCISDIRSADEILHTDLPPIHWVVKDLIIEGGVTLLSGKSKTGKTWLGLQIAVAVAKGESLFESPVKKGRVIYYHLEDGMRRIKDRLFKIGMEDGVDLAFISQINPLGTNNGIEELKKLIDKEKPILIIIDPLTAGRNLKLSEDKAEDVASIFYPIRKIAQETGVSFMIVHHHKKGSVGDPRDDARGSSVISGAVDITAGLYKEKGKDYRTLTLFGNDIDDQELRLAFNDFRYSFLGNADEFKITEARLEIVKAIKNLGTCNVKMISSFVGKSRERVQKILMDLIAEGIVTRSQKENDKSGCYYYSIKENISVPGVTTIPGVTPIPDITPLSDLPTWKKVV